MLGNVWFEGDTAVNVTEAVCPIPAPLISPEIVAVPVVVPLVSVAV